MAGPTPVSALIHAATMVVAGVFLAARMYPVFFEGFSIGDGGMNFMAIIGGITIIIGGLLAFVQRDIKKVLAYSTVSQIGYMVMALGVGAWTAAVFHLFTHAFFKALLFLGAGSVSHSGSHHSFDMKNDMGGLRKFMPVTFWTFMIGTAALCGIFPFAGFWSKDEILGAVYHADGLPGSVKLNPLLFFDQRDKLFQHLLQTRQILFGLLELGEILDQLLFGPLQRVERGLLRRGVILLTRQ